MADGRLLLLGDFPEMANVPKKMTPPTTPSPESSHLERLSSGGNLLTSDWMNHTRPPLLTTRGHPLECRR